MKRGQLWCCDVFPCFEGISSGFGVLEPRIHPYRHIRNYYLSNSKTFQDGNGNSGEINANDFQDGNWESMEMKV